MPRQIVLVTHPQGLNAVKLRWNHFRRQIKIWLIANFLGVADITQWCPT